MNPSKCEERGSRITYRKNGRACFLHNGTEVTGKKAEHIAAYEDADQQGRLFIFPCGVGSIAYFIFPEDEEPPFISEEKVNDVCTRGFFLSGSLDEPDACDHLITWDRVGKEVFFDKAEATATLAAAGRAVS